jgi:ankyrin repeat protein
MSQNFLKLIQRGATADIADAVATDPSLITWRDAQGVSSLLWSIYLGQPLVRDYLLAELAQAGIPLDVFEASAIGDAEPLAAVLAAAPESIHEYSGDGWTPLHLAAAFGTSEGVHLLLARGASVEAVSKNPQQNQPLHAALALGRNPGTIQILLDAGADPNARQASGFTALFSAAAANQRALAELLIGRGADPQLRSDQGKSAADFARERGHTEMADWLESLPRTPAA